MAEERKARRKLKSVSKKADFKFPAAQNSDRPISQSVSTAAFVDATAAEMNSVRVIQYLL
jgi:hypothetical protein